MYGQRDSIPAMKYEIDRACAYSTIAYGVDSTKFNPLSTYSWMEDPASEAFKEYVDDSNGIVYINWGGRVGTFTLNLFEKTQFGCEAYHPEITVTVIKPEYDLGYGDFLENCQGDFTTLEVDPLTITNGPAKGIKWVSISEDERDSTEVSVNNWSYQVNKTEKLLVKVFDGDGCVEYNEIRTKVHPLPEFDLEPDSLILCDVTEPYILEPTNSENLMDFEWTYLGETYYNPDLSVYPAQYLFDTISLKATDYNTCINYDTAYVLMCDVQALYENMANTITPDEGESEDRTWRIPHSHMFPNAVLEIFDRWGRLVYRSENIQEEWDGTSNGKPLPMDSYYFVLNLNFQGSEPVVGTVNIVR